MWDMVLDGERKVMRTLIALMVAVGGLLIANSAQAAVVALYDFPTVSGTTFPSPSSDTDTNSTAGGLALGAGFTINASTGAGISTVSGNPVNSLFLRQSDNTTEALAFSGNKFFTFTVTPGVGKKLSYQSLTFDYRRDTAGSAKSYALYASATGSFTSGVHVATGTMSTTDFSAADTIDLSTVTAFQNISDPVTFRLYIWGATGASASTQVARFDNITLSANIPEPAACGLLLGGLSLVLRRRRA